MGTVRTVLALLVALSHMAAADPAANHPLTGGAMMAVNLFFIISGFYMALILKTRYAGDVRTFYMARALRLYPFYWVVVVVTLILSQSAAGSHLLGFEASSLTSLVSGSAWWFAPVSLFSNISFFGLEHGVLFCINLSNGSLAVMGAPGCAALSRFTIVPQAWTLGLEVLFYALIPFILRGGRLLVLGAFAIGLATNLYLVARGIHTELWVRQFFPAVLLYFMTGVLAYGAYVRIKPWLPDLRHWWLPIAALLCSVAIGYAAYMPTLYYQQSGKEFLDLHVDPFVLAIFAILIPIAFHASKAVRVDAWIGDLSYPIYISHVAALAVSLWAADALGVERASLRIGLHVATIISIAVLGIILVTRPVEAVRSAVKRKAKKPEIARPAVR
jgi:peptidoglycan/LPS O-acetylase OafA/YrhL